jgi:hypothetical protein
VIRRSQPTVKYIIYVGSDLPVAEGLPDDIAISTSLNGFVLRDQEITAYSKMPSYVGSDLPVAQGLPGEIVVTV